MNVYRCFFGIPCEQLAPQRRMSYCLITCCMKIYLLLFALNWPPATCTWCSLVLILEKKANNPPLLVSLFSPVWLFSVVYHFSILNNFGHLNPCITLTSVSLHIFLYVCCFLWIFAVPVAHGPEQWSGGMLQLSPFCSLHFILPSFTSFGTASECWTNSSMSYCSC